MINWNFITNQQYSVMLENVGSFFINSNFYGIRQFTSLINIYSINQISSSIPTIMQNSQTTPQNSRKGGKYTKTPLSLKISLLNFVFYEGQPIKKASQALKIKYSTAKTLARQYKLSKQSIDWTGYQEKASIMKLAAKQLKRCNYLEIGEGFYQNGLKDGEGEPEQGNRLPFHNICVRGYHGCNAPSLQKIQIISTTLNKTSCIIPSSLSK